MATDNLAQPSEVTCQLCSELYSDPLMLPCLHSFCKKCIKQQVEEQEGSAGTLKCPTCDDTCSVPSNGFPPNLWLGRQAEIACYLQKIGTSGLCKRCNRDSASTVVFCCGCRMSLCSSCQDEHQRWQELANHKFIDLGKQEETKASFNIEPQDAKCPEHSDEKLKFYCENCEVLVCRDCIMLNHKQHPYKYQSDAQENGKAELQQILADCGKAIACLDETMDNGQKMLQRIKRRELQVNKEIENAFDSLHDQLEQRRRELLEKNKQLQVGKQTVTTMHLEDFQKIKEGLTFASQFVNSALETHSPRELLCIKKMMQEKLMSVMQKFGEVSLTFDVDEHTVVSLDLTTMSSQVARFGSVADVDSLKSYFSEGTTVPLAVVGKERKFKVVLLDENRERLNASVSSICASMKFKGEELAKEEVKINVVPGEIGVFQLTTTPQLVGEYEFSARIREQYLQQCPFTMWSRNPPNYPNATRQQHLNVGSQAHGVAVHPSGDVYVTSSSHCVHVFDSNAVLKHSIGSLGGDDGEFNCPRGVMLIGEVLYVIDQGNNRVQKFSTAGEYLGQFGSSGSGEGQLSSPHGICADGRGHVLVADMNNRRVVAFSTDGTYAFTIACGVQIYDVAVDNVGAIHITDYSNNRILVYSSDGQKELRTYSDTSGAFSYPMGLTVDEEGNAIVSCQYYQRSAHVRRAAPYARYTYHVRVLDSSNGARLAGYSASGQVCSIALDKNGHIYSADGMCVVKYVW